MLIMTLYKINPKSTFGISLNPILKEAYPDIELIDGYDEDYDFTQTLIEHGYNKDTNYEIVNIKYNNNDLESGKLFKDSRIYIELVIPEDKKRINVLNPPIIKIPEKQIPVDIVHEVTMTGEFNETGTMFINDREGLVPFYEKYEDIKELYDLYTDCKNMFVLAQVNWI